MEKEIIHTAKAPGAVGAYSQAVRVGNMIFTAGQVALDPATGTLIDGDIQAQTERAMQNLAAILAAAGSSFENVVKATVFLADIADFAGMNEVYGRFVGSTPPARSALQVGALPLGAKVEIEMIALVTG